MAEFDIANMGVVEGSEAAYEAPSEFFRPPSPTPTGELTTVIREGEVTDENFYPLRDFQTKQVIDGFSVNLKLKIVGGKDDDKKFNVFIDTRKFREAPGNQVQNYLREAGFTGPLVTVEQYKNAVQNHIGMVGAKLTWTGRKCDMCAKTTVKKLKDFPTRADGTLNHVTSCPECLESVGAQVKVILFKKK